MIKKISKVFTPDSAKKYIHFLANALLDILDDKQIYSDFNDALLEQKANNNMFIEWCIKNYHQTLCLSITAFLESPGNYRDGKTIYGLIEYLSNSKQGILDWNQKQTSKAINLDTGKIEEESISDYMDKKFNEINFTADLKKTALYLKKLEHFRNKKIAHLTTTRIPRQKIPTIKDLHEITDELWNMLMKYSGLFREGYSKRSIRKFPGYGNFKLTMI